MWIVSLFLAASFSQAAHAQEEFRLFQQSGSTYYYDTDEDKLPDPILGFRYKANFRKHNIVATKERVIWDVVLRTDAFGRRMTVQNSKKPKSKFLAVFGCSFTYGMGLNDDETLASQMAKQLPDFAVYNYGAGGSAPNRSLAYLQETDLAREIPEGKGTFVYVLLQEHIPRANGFLVERSWLGDSPYFEENALGAMERIGTLDSARPLRTFLYKGVTALSRRFGWFNSFNWPLQVGPAHEQYVCDLLVGHQKRAKEFRGSDFVVVGFPGMAEASADLQSCLAKNSIPYLYPRVASQSEDFYLEDHHPTPQLQQRFAAWLAPFWKTGGFSAAGR